MAEDRENEELENKNQLPEPVEPYPSDNEEHDDEGGEQQPIEEQFEEGEDLEIADETSHLASHPGRNLIMMVVIVLASATALYFILFSGGEEKKEEEEAPQISTKEVREATQETYIQEPDVGVIDAPAAPNITDIQAPESLPFEDDTDEPAEPDIEIPFDAAPPDFFGAPEPAVNIPIPDEPEPVLPDNPSLPDTDEPLPTAPGLEPIPGGASLPTPEEQAAMDAKRRSGIMLINGGGVTGEGEDGEGGVGGLFGGSGTAAATNPNVLAPTSAQQSVATTIGSNLNSIVAQGKMIDAVLETAINTDLPGVLRAIVSRDIYAESGKKVLIPKGSRLIGDYEAELEAGQKRVFVVWTRIIRPDGIDVVIESPGVDTLGRAGVPGNVDNRFMEIFGNAVLLSALTVTGAYVLETITGATETSSSTTTASDGSTTQNSTGTPTSFAISEAATDLSDTASDIVSETVNTQPRITVPQGTRIKVFVNSDLIFPSSVSQSVRFIN